MADDLEDELDPQEDERQTARIARPMLNAAENTPLVARGLGPVTPSAGTADLEAQGLTNHLAPRPIATPSPLEARTATDQTELGRLQSSGSGISQVKNPIGRGALRTLDTIGSIAAPRITQHIPGTELHHQALIGQEESRIGQDQKQAEAEANLGKTQADTGEAQARTAGITEETSEAPEKLEVERQKANLPEWKNVPGIIGPNGEPVEMNEKTGEHRYGDVTGAKPIHQPGETQEQNKVGFQTIVGKVDAAGLPTDPKSLARSLDTAATRKVITAAEHSQAQGYLAANPTPGTNLTVRIAGQDEANANAINKLFEGKEVIAYMPDGRRVQMSYADAKKQGLPPERLVALSAQESQQNRDKSTSTDATFKSLDTYRSDFKSTAPKLNPSDRDAMRILASHAQDGTTAGILGGLLDEIPLAGPISSYSNKLLNGTMTSDQYKQLSPAGKKLVSDYFTAVIANFANMKNIMGSVGRNPMQLQAEINTIPLPFLDWESADPAFENKKNDLMRRALSQPELYQPGK